MFVYKRYHVYPLTLNLALSRTISKFIVGIPSLLIHVDVDLQLFPKVMHTLTFVTCHYYADSEASGHLEQPDSLT